MELPCFTRHRKCGWVSYGRSVEWRSTSITYFSVSYRKAFKRDVADPFRASTSFVKKKAALTLLRLYRKLPSVVQAEWTERIIALMDDPDIGVALSVTSLVLALAQDDPEQYRTCYNKAANRLQATVTGQDCPQEYLYYNVPCPWLQVKLLRLMQCYPPSGE